jgi:hypothetical protein
VPARATVFHLARQLARPSACSFPSAARLPVSPAWRACIRPAPALQGPQLSSRILVSLAAQAPTVCTTAQGSPNGRKSSQLAKPSGRSSYPPPGARADRLARPTPRKSDRVHPVRRRSANAQRAASSLPSAALLHHAAPCRATHDARDNGGIGPCSSTLPTREAHKAPSTSPVEPPVPVCRLSSPCPDKTSERTRLPPHRRPHRDQGRRGWGSTVRRATVMASLLGHSRPPPRQRVWPPPTPIAALANPLVRSCFA